ncbi:quinone oxidoreductase 1 [Spatholobus suberectus]|nr:quinone oxidoreductase 1 [Spatholobus suberectus]
MPKRRTKKTAKATKPIPGPQTQQPQFMDLEIQAMERQIGAIRAVRDVEIEHLLTGLRLLRSSFSSEELQKPVLQVFEETLPNLSVVSDQRSKKLEVRWKEKESCDDGMDAHASLLQRLSIASIPRFPGFEYSTNAGRMSFVGADDLHFKEVALEEPSDTRTLAVQEGLQTPGVTSQRLSVGMTPKTLRLPKPGEMLLSVHGSPLGVYKENNMEAIQDEGYLKIKGPMLLFIFQLALQTSSFALDSQLDGFGLPTIANFGMGCSWKSPTELSDYCSIFYVFCNCMANLHYQIDKISLACLKLQGYMVCFGKSSVTPDPVPFSSLAMNSLFLTRSSLLHCKLYCGEVFANVS